MGEPRPLSSEAHLRAWVCVARKSLLICQFEQLADGVPRVSNCVTPSATDPPATAYRYQLPATHSIASETVVKVCVKNAVIPT